MFLEFGHYLKDLIVYLHTVNDLGGSAFGGGSGSKPADDVVNEIISKGGKAVANYGETFIHTGHILVFNHC